MDISYLETLTLSHLPEDRLEIAEQVRLNDTELHIPLPQWLNEEEMQVFAQVGQVTLYHP